jgi:hypothetical protein
MQKNVRFDKYELYTRAVQDPPAMVDFLANVGRECSGRWPKRLREDFCGTFSLAEEWVDRDKKNTALVVDNAAEPLNYGQRRAKQNLPADAFSRITVDKRDVLARKSKSAPADVICAFNFSYGVFKERPKLKTYLQLCHQRLAPKGIVALDVLGGIELASEMQTEADFPDFHYTWEQVSFDPLTRHAKFHIHFQRPGEAARKKAFVYEWRMWTVAELKDLLQEVGFKDTFVYCEGTGRVENGDSGPAPGESWVAYVVGRK